VRVSGAIDFEIEDIVPFGKENAEPVKFAGMFHPVAPDLTLAEATRSHIGAFGIRRKNGGSLGRLHPASGFHAADTASVCCSRFVARLSVARAPGVVTTSGVDVG
jgi:hypothetical protein